MLNYLMDSRSMNGILRDHLMATAKAEYIKTMTANLGFPKAGFRVDLVGNYEVNLRPSFWKKVSGLIRSGEFREPKSDRLMVKVLIKCVDDKAKSIMFTDPDWEPWELS